MPVFRRTIRLPAFELKIALIIALVVAAPDTASACCGLYVTKVEAALSSQTSKVVMARNGNKTVVTMASDYKGYPADFAIIIPVPAVITQKQVHVTENALVDYIDLYSAPRMVEYFDSDPCQSGKSDENFLRQYPDPPLPPVATEDDTTAQPFGVTTEAQYSVGEYDILVLSATQSEGLEAWLRENGYHIPEGASPVLRDYIRQGMKFFVVKVNLVEQEKLGFQYLRPIQVAYESPQFMLPIRLSAFNAGGPHDLFIYLLTPRGRVEITNYPAVAIPTGDGLPLFTNQKAADFYKAMFDTQVKKNGMRTVFLEYAWNMGWCDPCVAYPVPNDMLVELGAFWMAQQPELVPMGIIPPHRLTMMPPLPPRAVFITRLHLRYDREHFPEDLMFQETSDTDRFQVRHALHQPWTGESSCPSATEYRRTLQERFGREAENMAQLTGWDIDDIHKQMIAGSESPQSFSASGNSPKKWYELMWK